MKTGNRDIKTGERNTRLWAFFTLLVINLSLSGQAFAQDDGARSYWNARAGTNVVSFQYLNMNIGASASNAFAPGQYIYPSSTTHANVFVGTWAHHMTFLNRPSTFAVNLIGGNVDVGLNTNNVPPEFLPPGVTPGTSFSQSSSGFSDPNLALVVNLFGTPKLKSGVDLLNYEPTISMDVAVLLAVPIGEYQNDKLVNLGLNRWYGRLAFPLKYNFGVFTPGYMSSFELIPSVWLFAENDDFVGQKLENEVMWQLESHLTHDFTSSFFGSLDLLYQNGFQSKVDGNEVGEKLEIGSLGFTLNYQITDNVTMRTSFSSNLFGDSDLETSSIRLQFVYGWHKLMENMKKLQHGH
jgi:hypothetical protein